MTPLVTIVTPVLNRRATIQLCLHSVASQTYRDVEHIVVDGGSDDGTVDVIADFDSPRLRWISEPDQGMYDAINKGMALARGDVLAYLNSDDLYLPWSIETAVGELRRGADFVYGDLGILHRSNGSWAFYPQFYVPFDLTYYTHHATLGQPTVFWSRDAFERTGRFDTSYKLLGDCEYWVRAARAGETFRHVHEILALQVEHDETLRATQPAKMREEFRRMRQRYGGAATRTSAVYAGFRRRVRWRWFQSQFILEGRLRGHRWPRFMSFLRDHQIPMRRSGLFWFMLPEKIRPSESSLLDADLLMSALQRGARHDGADA